MGRKKTASKNAADAPQFTRRSVLRWAGLALTGAAVPAQAADSVTSFPRKTVSSPGSAVMNELSSYMSEAVNRPLPEEVTEKTKHHVVDTLAAMISGSQLLPGERALQFAKIYPGVGDSTVVASQIVGGPIECAMANGVLAHADETDDSHSPSQSHPGCAVVPAALAAGEQFRISGTHFLRSVALGYDIGTRVTVTLGGQRFESESHWSTHSIAPLFGAAAAAGCAARLDPQQTRWMLGYTAQQSSGLGAWNRDTQHIQKAFLFGGMNARSGVTSALLVHAGWTGVDDIFSGKDNFFAAYNPHADLSGLIDKLGERYEILRTNIKKWPVGSPIQAALDALETIRGEHPFDAGIVKEVIVRLATDEAAIVDNREIPDICVQHMLAVALVDKTITFSMAHDRERMKDASILRERAKIKLVPDAGLERLMPLRVAILEVTLTDGTELTRRVDSVRGTPANPMTREEVLAKARDLIVPVLGAQKCVALLDKLIGVERVSDLRELRPLLQTTGS
jgi:2-methylcitrate dehydratase PrpD